MRPRIKRTSENSVSRYAPSPPKDEVEDAEEDSTLEERLDVDGLEVSSCVPENSLRARPRSETRTSSTTIDINSVFASSPVRASESSLSTLHKGGALSIQRTRAPSVKASCQLLHSGLATKSFAKAVVIGVHMFPNRFRISISSCALSDIAKQVSIVLAIIKIDTNMLSARGC